MPAPPVSRVGNCPGCGETHEIHGYRAPFCRDCWFALPSVTRESFSRGLITEKVAAEAARERRVSVKTLGGGQHTR